MPFKNPFRRQPQTNAQDETGDLRVKEAGVWDGAPAGTDAQDFGSSNDRTTQFLPDGTPVRGFDTDLMEDITAQASGEVAPGGEGLMPQGQHELDGLQSDAGAQGIYPDEHGRVAPTGAGQPGDGGDVTRNPMDAEFTDEFKGGPPGPQRMDAEFTDEFRGGRPGPQRMDAEFTDELTGDDSGSTLLQDTPVGERSGRTELLNLSGDAPGEDGGQITAEDDWETPVV